MLKGSQLREKLGRGEVALGASISFNDPAVGEVMAGLGFDWIWIDTEHSPFGLDRLQNQLIAVKGTEAVVLVRAAWNDVVIIKQILDLGPDGVIIPWVNSAEEARVAVAACKYPPDGVRGFGPRRAGEYSRKLAEYVERANDEIFVAVQAETEQAVENVREIVAVPGIDAVMIGPADLSMSMDVFGQFEHPRMEEAIGTIIAAGKEAGVPIGMFSSGEMVKKWIPRGLHCVSIGGDNVFMQAGATGALSAMRDWLQEGK